MALRGGDFTTHMDGYNEAHNKMHTLPLIQRDLIAVSSAKKDTLRRLYQLSKPEHSLLILSAITLAITSAVQLCIPAATGTIIDVALHPSKDEYQWATSTLLMGLFFIMAVAAYLTYIRTVWQAQAGHTFTARMRQQTYARILAQDATFFDVTPQGDILSRLASDADCLQLAVTEQGLMLVRSVIMSLGAVSLLLYTSWSLALIAMTVLPPTMITARYVGRSMKAQHVSVRELHGQATSLAEQALTCLSTVQQFCAEVFEVEKYGKAVQEAHNSAVGTAKLQAQSFAFIQLLANGSMLCILGYGGSLISSGALSAGALAGFVMYSLLMAGNVSSISTVYVDLMKAVAALDRLLEIIDRKPAIPPPPVLMEEVPSSSSILEMSIPKTISRPMSITFDRVSFSYPARPDVLVLNDFSLKVLPGQVVALVGGSGAGKSTVAALLTRLYNISEGSILLDGATTTDDWTPQQVRQSIGIVAQEPLLFPTSIADNIRYGRLTATHDEVLEAARLAHVLEFANQMPQGMDTIVGPRGTQLSGGQKQRVAVARCLLKNPSILILDEATSALDAESEHHVQRAIDTACQGRTVLLIAHRLSSIRTAGRVAVLRDGRVAEYGSFDELVAKPNGVFRRLIERQLID
jgi:ABC-type multidrug transport system fused ATPase/permease subunit